MKTKEEINELKIEYESLSRKLAELTDEELAEVSGGVAPTDDTSVSPPVPTGEHAFGFGADSAPIDVGVHE